MQRVFTRVKASERKTLTRKELIMVAPGRMGYSLMTTKLSPSMKLPFMATTAGWNSVCMGKTAVCKWAR